MTSELANEIINTLANEEFIEVDIRQLIHTWFGKPTTGIEITRKLLDFTKEYDLKYGTIL